ncbi:MAG TPA: CHASE3 domain-containing protein [Burkholderiaceae bacterium]|nr:CHASE3 domain-containing protein [Burkholderiaceae bacterium]
MNAWTVAKRNPVVVALALLAAVALLFVSEGTHWQSLVRLERLAAGHAERTNVRDLHIGMLDAETALRGYLLTNDRAHLQAHAKGLAEAAASLDELDRFHQGDARAQPVLAALRRAVAAQRADLAHTLRSRDEAPNEVAPEDTASDLGAAPMETLRALTTELLAQDAQMRATHFSELRATLAVSRVGVAALSLIGLVALFLYLGHGDALREHAQALERMARIKHDRLEIEVHERTAELTDLTRHLLSAREDERSRLARDLHDELGSLLTSAKLDAARIKSRLGDGAPEAQERLAHLVTTLNAGIALGRRIIEDLRPSTLSNLGLVAALEILAREFAERSGVRVHCALEPVGLSPSAELVVYRMVQEGITNLSKHAKATEVWITLRGRDGRVEASVRDNGLGFDTAKPPTSAFGLLGMRYRAEGEQGCLAVASAPGQGTTLSLSLPVSH